MNPYIGYEFQLFGVEEYTLHNGKKEGMKILHLKNGHGLEMCISLNRGGDISMLSLNGKNMSYLCANGYVHNCFYDEKGAGWIKSFTGGFLTTCGFNNVGNPCSDEDGEYPLHGSINCIPVDSYSYDVVEDKYIDVKTIVLDEGIFARKLKRIRHIKVSLNENVFSIEDEIVNRGDATTPVLVLYHMNMGYPLLKEDSIVFINSSSVEPRNEHAKEGIKDYLKVEKPTVQYEEMCYYHKMINGKAGIFSPSEDIGLIIEYDCSKLKEFTEWKMMGIRDYVLGLEPGNVNPDGFVVNKQKGKITFLKPDEKLNYALQIKLFDKIDDFKEGM